MKWKIHHCEQTLSTNIDARGGFPGDVFTADFQTGGRGRLDHKWQSPKGENLMMSAVLDAKGLSPEQIATFPLAAGLAVLRGLSPYLRGISPALIKWPNDIIVCERKIAGILCERCNEMVVAGIGVNVNQRDFPEEIKNRATSLALLGSAAGVGTVRESILSALAAVYGQWREGGFAAIHPEIAACDYLQGRMLAVSQTDEDSEPICGICGGIQRDGSLLVGDRNVYAGEAHILSLSGIGFS